MTTAIAVPEPRVRSAVALRDLLWLTWRQHRWFLVGGFVLVAATTGLLLWQAAQMRGLLPQVQACQGGCASGDAWRGHEDFATNLERGGLAVIATAIAVFLGAPLVSREYEQRTHLIAWTQDVSPGRWLVAKAAVLAVAAAGLVLVFTVGVTAVEGVREEAGADVTAFTPWEYQVFDTSAPVFLAYTLFALALGIAVGTLVRRTVPAMAITFVAFAAVRLGLYFARPYFLPPLVMTQPLGEDKIEIVADRPPNSLHVESGFTDAAGNRMDGLPNLCGGTQREWVPCLRAHGVTGYTEWLQPGSRVLLFQWMEIGFFAVFAVALFVLAWRRVRARTVA
ncbi:ABC transporter permease subunit [Amycolatopsis anabasis]|uniref:ABC transporter permease subunit n=1 Tax=Amycolatopsis anabasis TaxID=1840409 RepID=UPI00131D5235|nr:ABC transporter permease subunit [Amycolatopsis anabasis]